MSKKDRYFGVSKTIARWKLDNLFENYLSYKADNSELWKSIYVLYYKIFDRKYYKCSIQMCNEYIKLISNFHKLPKKFILQDMIYSLHRFGLSFQDYYIYDLIDKSSHAKSSFISDKLRYHYCDILNASDVYEIMIDKEFCYKTYKEFYKREVLGCHLKEDLQNFLSFVKKYPRFIYKPLKKHSGQGIDIYNSSEINVTDFFFEKLKTGSFVVEQLIEQKDEVSKMHPQSVNTCRVVTFVIDSKVYILGVTWRIGVSNSVVDNAGSDGIYAKVDALTGVVQTVARNYNGDTYIFHPDTKLKIVGFRFPDWDEAKNLIEKIALKKKGATLISWDLAYSKGGWCMVEANDNGDFSILQSNEKQGLKDKLFALMDEYFEK